jgi:hypothetical protein
MSKRKLQPLFQDVPESLIWKMEVCDEKGYWKIPYSTLSRCEKQQYFCQKTGLTTPLLKVHKINNRFIFYERLQIKELKRIRDFKES